MSQLVRAKIVFWLGLAGLVLGWSFAVLSLYASLKMAHFAGLAGGRGVWFASHGAMAGTMLFCLGAAFRCWTEGRLALQAMKVVKAIRAS